MTSAASKINYDTKTTGFKGHKLKILVTKDEVQGYVDNNEVYSVYIKDLKNIRTSLASCPSGDFVRSQAWIKCMTMVCATVNEIIDAGK